MENLFFKPRIGKNSEGRLILLATAPCTHKKDCKYFTECTIKGRTAEFNSKCPFPDYSLDTEAHKLRLDENVDYIVEKHILDKYHECGEKRNRTLTKLTNALGECFFNKRPIGEKEKRAVWDNVMVTELCQHFIPYGVGRSGSVTLRSDFLITNDYSAFKELIDKYSLSKILILGTPSWQFLKNRMENDDEIVLKHECKSNGSPDPNGYIHYLDFNSHKITLIYAWHPSYSRFYDNGRLIKILQNYFL